MTDTIDTNAKGHDTPLADEESLVCEALVREIAHATRWSAVIDGYNALGHVRLMASGMHREAAMFDGKSEYVE